VTQLTVDSEGALVDIMRISHAFTTFVATGAACLLVALAAPAVTAQSKQAKQLMRVETARAKCTAQFSGRWYVNSSSLHGSQMIERCVQHRMRRE
jgi:hypothetical protein